MSFKSFLWFKTAKSYYQIQFYEQALKKSIDTRNYFDKALEKAEKSYEEEDKNVTQLIITNLKLGLAEIENKIARFSSKLEHAKVELGFLMGKDFFDLLLKVEKPLRAVSFPYQNWQDFLKKNPEFFNQGNSLAQNNNESLIRNLKLEFKIRSHQAFIRILEARKKMQIASRVSKSLRALMAIETSNYDLGLGKPLDLFDSFLIYSRHINVSLESIYNFNIAVAEWRRVTGILP